MIQTLKCPKCKKMCLDLEETQMYMQGTIIFKKFRLVCMECSFTTRYYIKKRYCISGFKQKYMRKAK